MNTMRAWFGLFCLLAAAAWPAAGENTRPESSSPYVVAWDTPSADSGGTMPLGNGEVALNAWIDAAGDLKFYIARTDSWDDSSRLAKIGAVRVRVGDGAAERTRTFHQELTVKDGTIRARYGAGADQVELRLWVDANRPVICVEAQTAKPTEATAFIELWRNRPTEIKTQQTSDIFARTTSSTLVEPDTMLAGLTDCVGWYHRNIKSIGPELCAKLQGVADFPREDPILHRTFGALVAAGRPRRTSDRTLQSTAGTRHLFEIYVLTKHPATAAQWLAEAQRGLAQARAVSLAERRAAHERWWTEFWNRSWIHITANGKPAARPAQESTPAIPANKLPLRLGMAQDGSLRFSGAFGRVGIYDKALSDAEVAALAALDHQAPSPAHPARCYGATPESPQALPDLTEKTFQDGLTIEAWLKPAKRQRGREMRIADKITPGGRNGFLFDTHPGLGLRLISGAGQISKPQALRAELWQHVAATVTPQGAMKIYLDGKVIAGGNGESATDTVAGDDATIVTRAYALQRFINACAGRGNYPIKYNGSLFTVPSGNNPDDADFRRWGPGYWWQNTRLPYYSMCMSGDTDLLEPLFRMYGRDLMPLFKFRTQRYLGHGGIYIPECIYFWGDVFTETYGWTPYEERADKLQTSGYHKWEWVSGLELAGLMLDRYEHTGDARFLSQTALPLAHEVLAFFGEHYPAGADGKLVMHPAQALETWWDCTNPMPELAGLHAITGRLLELSETALPAPERAFLKALQARLPDLPTTVTAAGKTKLAPAAVYKNKRNIENPELYAVFPFRLFALDKPHLDWAVEALNTRTDKGPRGWRQDDLFMAWLGQTGQARDYVVTRARTKNAQSRFPAFWGPNYDWTPDQCHGGVLLAGVQSLLMQTDGRKIYLLPAWPADWNAEFKLHAPFQTVVEGKVRDGKVVELKVTPPERKTDVIIWSAANGE